MKQNLLLLHGALGSKEQFAELKELLSDKFNVFDLNFSGHGGLVVPESFNIDLFVEDTLDFMGRHGLRPVDMFGYSMGGYVALQMAHDFPERVGRIMTLGTKFHWTPESAAKEVRMMNPEVIAHKIPAFADSLAERHAPQDWKRIMNLTAEMMTGLGDGSAMKEEDFQAISNETLVSIGTEDHMVTRDESALVAKLLKHGTLRIIDGFKHPLEAVDKSILAGIMREFFLQAE